MKQQENMLFLQELNGACEGILCGAKSPWFRETPFPGSVTLLTVVSRFHSSISAAPSKQWESFQSSSSAITLIFTGIYRLDGL